MLPMLLKKAKNFDRNMAVEPQMQTWCQNTDRAGISWAPIGSATPKQTLKSQNLAPWCLPTGTSWLRLDILK